MTTKQVEFLKHVIIIWRMWCGEDKKSSEKEKKRKENAQEEIIQETHQSFLLGRSPRKTALLNSLYGNI